MRVVMLRTAIISLCFLVSTHVKTRVNRHFVSASNSSSFETTRKVQENLATTFITYILKHDEFPTDLSWTLTNTGDGTIVDSRQSGFYTEARKIDVYHIAVVPGATYSLTVIDEWGDGFDGYIKLYYGKANIFGSHPGDLIAFIDGFSDREHSITFTARLPTPTASPTPVPPSPTHAPTRCVESVNLTVLSYPFTKDPVYTTTRFEFGISEAICASHTNYADCTSESREDCQWIFLTQGNRNGKCRVDPIAKCLQTGDCVCSTSDFHGGDADGILFHVPISITARDISPNNNKLSYFETYTTPLIQNTKHPQDDTFFISKVDFTGRQLRYEFDSDNPTVTSDTKSVFFKLHYLYTDIPIEGTIWDGLGLTVAIDTSLDEQVIIINGRNYILHSKLRIWTCTQIAVTPDTLYVAGVAIPRSVGDETSAPPSDLSLRLGPFSGELFDVRVYSGAASLNQVHEVGARCAGPNDLATIKKYEDIETLFLEKSCQEINSVTNGQVPTNGIQTYGSGALATLWMRPTEDPLSPGTYLNVPEGHFDEEYFFQHAKLQSYQWERHYFENDMIGFVTKPYRMFTADEMPEWSKKTFNNPCRYIHQNNNNWDFPLYSEDTIPKWTVERHAKRVADSADAVFDLGVLYRNGGYIGYTYFTHEAFHEFHVRLVETYDAQPSGWLQESTAEGAPALLFPGGRVSLAAFVMTPAWPLSFDRDDDGTKNPHIFSNELSLGDIIRGGHYYGSWVVWWFLSQHAGLPHLLGQMFSVDRRIDAYWHGKLFLLRLLLKSNDIDLGDAYAIFAAHLRTWDFKNAALLKETEQFDFMESGYASTTTLEGRKTAAYIDPTVGTNGAYVTGPEAFRPSPFSWNCLTASGVAAGKVLAVSLRWADGMGFASNVTPAEVVQQHVGCDSDVRFYNSMVVLHNEATGERRYWKVKGKDPATLYINTGSSGPVTLHVLLLPTPPADYTGGRNLATDQFVTPLPAYSYEYKIEVFDSAPDGASVSASAEKEFGVVKFDHSLDLAWFSAKCSCLDDPDDQDRGRLCVRPVFEDVPPIPVPSPTQAPTVEPILPTTPPSTRGPTFSPTLAPTIETPTESPTLALPLAPTLAPTTKNLTESPTLAPTFPPTLAPTTKTPTEFPSLSPSFVPTPVTTIITRTKSPTLVPSPVPTLAPTLAPSTVSGTAVAPSFAPTIEATLHPSVVLPSNPSPISSLAPSGREVDSSNAASPFNPKLETSASRQSSPLLIVAAASIVLIWVLNVDGQYQR